MFANILVMRISIGNGGWVAVDGLDLPGPLFIRMRDRAGRLRIAELYLDASSGEDSIDSSDLQGLPLSQLEAFVNTEAELIKRGLTQLAPDISTLASFYATSFGKPAEQVAQGNWVVASFVAQYEVIKPGERAVLRKVGPGQTDVLTGKDATAALASDPSLPRVLKVKPAERKDWIGLREAEREFRMSGGPTDGLTDEFLATLAKAYRAAVARGERPNVSIAEQTGYPVKTVQRWVYTARERRIMPRGSKGRVG